ncbi:SANT/Myb_domain [Hexamita inflata]|uniref:SANT/Myb domain n=1 Tax=Hexamita inflata TaxID=28002 RepID=A0AA86R5C6_9EUKA|nr:SANT/Myb domain [Hexamita inflata]
MKKTQLWSEAESKLFLDLMKKYHNDFVQIAEELNRTYSQVRSHYYNLFRKPKSTSLNKQTKQKPQESGKNKQKQKVKKKNKSEHYSYIIFDELE